MPALRTAWACHPPEGPVSENIQRQMDEAVEYGKECGVDVLFHQIGDPTCPN